MADEPQRIEVVVVDTMTCSYLQGLGSLPLIREVGVATRAVVFTKAVVRQLHRSGMLGPQVQSWCDRGEVELVSPKVGEPIARATQDVLRSKDGGLVGKNVVDVELIEVARARGGAVLSCERGVANLAGRRNTPVLDLADFFAWCISLGLLSEAEAEDRVEPWQTPAAGGTGAPRDVRPKLAATLAARPGHAASIARLPVRRS